MNSFQDLTADFRSKAEDNQLNAMDELMTDFRQVDIDSLRVEIEKNEVEYVEEWGGKAYLTNW